MKIRPVAAELTQHAGDKPSMDRTLDIADGKAPDRTAGQVAAKLLQPPRVRQQRTGFGQEGAALGIEMNPLLCPLEQSDAKLLFQLHDLPTERRLRNMQQFGGSTHIAGFGDGDEISDLAQVERFCLRY